MLTILHAGHGLTAGHVHPWEGALLGGLAIGILAVQWFFDRRGS